MEQCAGGLMTLCQASGGLKMGNDIYAKSGGPIGFHDDKVIYDLYGCAVGELRGSRVYCMAGHYVGELRDGIIRDKNRSYPDIGARSGGSRRSRAISHARRTGSRFRRKA
jgi:hypothetical protein